MNGTKNLHVLNELIRRYETAGRKDVADALRKPTPQYGLNESRLMQELAVRIIDAMHRGGEQGIVEEMKTTGTKSLIGLIKAEGMKRQRQLWDGYDSHADWQAHHDGGQNDPPIYITWETSGQKMWREYRDHGRGRRGNLG